MAGHDHATRPDRRGHGRGSPGAGTGEETIPGPDRLSYQRWAEGRCAQLLHLGPYADEGPSIVRLHQAIAAAGYRPRGRHHETYLGDPRRSAPEKLRTILRHPVEPQPT